ncbi:mesothelin-like protein [Megalops cyprinoides]|uniref:mesothelin-like protein n=1 Tax=Megalops cyprinoides TaxID=118141 RepID=UPI001863C6DE|nr:mesothelin-like protein [Megalops cyprinoides]
MAIVQVLMKGNFQIDSGEKLQQLGSLVAGVSASTITNIDASQLLQTSKNQVFITNIMTAPQIIQQTFVNQIITVNSQPVTLLENVPDTLATGIPRTYLSGFSQETVVVEKINRKSWKYEQAVLFFDTVANGFSDPNVISSSVLQGFTCTRVQTFAKVKVKNLIKACRRGGVNKVVLRESQLTCMYNYIKDDDPGSFLEYPPDMLLYYDYEKVPQGSCRGYFTEIGAANFDVLSESLIDKKITLLDNAKNCLGITGTTISGGNIEVLGNMCCTLDGSYINNSDSLILEKLKNCNDLSDTQIKSIEYVLLAGNTKYGQPSTWNSQTLEKLDSLPLYMTSTFWSKFSSREIKKFLKSFLKARRKDRTERRKLKKLFNALTRSSRSKRAAVSECTVGMITQVTISDDAFPFGYDFSTFNICLTATTVKDNLAALTGKVYDDPFQRVILDKLNQAYPTGIPDEQVQVLGSVSRVALADDISKWNVTKIDTLAALMNPDDGQWEPDKSRAIITKYLNTAGNTLGTAELNSIGGPNLCSLDASVLKGINPDSLRNANPLTISNCTTEKKKELFSVANNAFSNRNAISVTVYQLMQPYLDGAPLDYIVSLSTSNVSMDMLTFTSLDENVIMALTVNHVKGLLGRNLPDLKTYENQTVVANWISGQFRSDLNTLGLNLVGGKPDTVPTGVGVINTTATATVTTGSSTTVVTGTTNSTTASGHGGESTKSTHVLHGLLLAMALTALQILQ